MSKRRIIRRIERSQKSLDEQFWPVAVSMVALAAFLVGLAAANFHFDDPRWRSNAYVVIAVILCLSVVSGLVLRQLGRRFGKYLMQAALVLSILLHLILGIVIVKLGVPSRVVATNQENGKPRRQPEEQTNVPIELDSPQRERQDEPVELADATAQQVTVSREQAVKEATLQRQTQDLASVVETVRPSILDRREAPTPTPKLAESESQLSQRRITDSPPIDAQVMLVDNRAQPDTALAQLEPSEVEVKPSENHGVPDRNEVTPTDTLEPSSMKRAVATVDPQLEDVPSPASRSTAKLALNSPVDPVALADTTPVELPDAQQLAINRRELETDVDGKVDSQRLDASPEQVAAKARPREHTSEPEAVVAATPIPRSNDMRRLTLNTQADSVDQAPPSDNAPTTQPSETALAKSDNSSSDQQREMVTPPDASPAESRQPLRLVQSERSIETPSAGKIARDLSAAPSISTIANPLSTEAMASSESASREGLRPTDSTVARQTVATRESTRRQQNSDTAQFDNLAALARQVSRRDVASPELTLQPNQVPNRTPRRAANVADLQSPAMIESPAFVETPGANAPNSQPQIVALNRGEFGEAGAGISRNMRSELPGPERPSPVASGAARRPEETANPSDLPTLSSGQDARVATNLADRPQPNVANQAVLVDGPTTSRVDSEPLAAAAGAAMERSRANSNQADLSVDKGDLSVDRGPTRITSEFQNGQRASGGGQPDLAQQLTQNNPTQRSPGGVPRVSIMAELPAASVAANPGDGGGRPRAIDASSVAVGPRRADPGAQTGVSGEIALADRVGPSTEVSVADVFAALALPKATGIQSDPADSMAGNSTPKAAASRRSPSLNPTADIVAVTVGTAESSSGQPSTGEAVANVERTDVASTVGTADRRNAPMTDNVAVAPGPVIRRRGESVDEALGRPQLGGGSVARNNRAARGPQPIAQMVTVVDDIAAGTPNGGGPTNETEQFTGLDKVAIRRADRTTTRLAGGSEGRRTNVLSPEGQGGGRTGAGPNSQLTPNITGSQNRVALQPGSERPVNVQVAAMEGVGGIGRRPASQVGSVRRDARNESELFSTTGPRFVRTTTGGRPQISMAAAMATDAFRDRMRLRNSTQPQASSGPLTNSTIELGLGFLAGQQQSDGRWTLAGYGDDEPAMVSDTAATGLSLLAFQGAGYHHLDYKYEQHVRGALRFLVSNQRDDGGLFVLGNSDANSYAEYYSHGIAAIALCEAYGMTQDPWLREPAQKCLDFIVDTQTIIRSGDESYGGWRYTVGMGPDTSVTGWMLMALKSGELAGLDVPDETYAHVAGWLKRARVSETEPHLFRYNPFADDDAKRVHGRKTSTTMTAVGLLMQLYLDWDRRSAGMKSGGDYLAKHPPAMGNASQPLNERTRDTYYWYYATQVMFHLGGDYWQTWNDHLQPMLVGTQIKRGANAGSWDPLKPVPDRWAGQGGRLYVTTMNLLSLEVPYRHLPLYEDTAK